MAVSRDEARLNSSSFTAYSYTECDWEVQASICKYTHKGGITSPYGFNASATAQPQWWENGTWHDYGTAGTETFTGYGDLELFEITDSFARQATDRVVSVGTYTSMMGASARSFIDYTVPHLAPAVTWDTITRNSDTSITLSWNAPALEYSAMCLEVSIDGGSWSQFAVLWNTATSFTWTGCSADHSYRFRIRTNYLASYSAYDTYATAIVMTPTAPSSITTAAAGGTSVAVTLSNASPVATGIEYQTSSDGSNWSASTTVSGSPVTSFTVALSGTGYIRVRNVNATGASSWLVSDKVTTIAPPNPPTLLSPSGIVSTADGSVTFSWLHNAVDGSSQTAAQLEYSDDDFLTSTIVDVGTEQSYTLNTIPWAVGSEVMWHVRTKGADASYSQWSQTQTFNVYSPPTLVLNVPATVTGMPISISATYSDMVGFTCQAATVSLQKDGRTLYSEPATISGTSITASLDVTEFLPTNGETYTVVMTARSSSSLQTSANATFTVDFVEPQAGELNITNDPETGYASLLATFDNSASEVEYSGATNVQYESAEGYVRSLTVEGKSEKWNQLVDSYATTTQDGITISYNSSTHLFSIENLSRTSNYSSGSSQGMLFGYVIGHKYAICGDDVVGVGITRQYSNGGFAPLNSIFEGQQNESYPLKYSLRVTSQYDFVTAHPVGDVTTFHMSIYDLTEIFGSGNEPATVDAFKATDVYKAKLAAGELYDYDAGSLVSIEGAGVTRNISSTAESDWEQGSINEGAATGSSYEAMKVPYNNRIRVKQLVSVEPSTSYTVFLDVGYRLFYCCFNDEGYTRVYAGWLSNDTGRFTFTTDANTTAIGYAIRKDDNTNIAPSEAPTVNMRIYRTADLSLITTPLRSAGSVSDELQADTDSWTVERRVGVRAYQAGDESDPDVLTDGTTTYYALSTPTTDPETSMSTIEIGSAFTVATDLDSTFAMTTWDGSADAVSISVSRVNADGTLTPLITDGASGSGAVDKYAPLNTAYQYAVTTKASTQAVETVYVDNELVTDLWFAYWTHRDGDTVTEMTASAKWNPDNGGIQVTRPQKTRVYYAGRRDPVSYDGHAVALTETPSWMFIEQDEVSPFVQLIEDGGRGVYKSCDGWVYHADFDLTMTPKYTAIGYYGGASLGITRIAGDRL